jgi:hypothetical protein
MENHATTYNLGDNGLNFGFAAYRLAGQRDKETGILSISKESVDISSLLEIDTF